MDLKEFFDRFLPDFNFNEFLKKNKGISSFDVLRYFENNFPEALQNYTDKACKMQRENCQEEWYNAEEFMLTAEWEVLFLNAPQPKMEEI